MSRLRAQLFGRFCIRLDEHEPAGFESSRVRELFAYLATHREQPLARESLAEHLWSASSDTQARKYLRQTLWQLQAALDSGEHTTDLFFTVDPDSIQLNPRADMWLDVRSFELAAATVVGVAGERFSPEQAASVKYAVNIYKGDLLEGWYQDWCLFERERLQLLNLSMLDKLVTYAESRYEYDDAVGYAERILHHDRAHERAHRRLMRLYYLAGDRTAALRQFDRCVAGLAEELDVAPSRETVALHEQIRRDQLDPKANSHESQDERFSLSTRFSVADPIGALKRAILQLSSVQDALETELRSLEQRPIHKG